jgi:CubicO group peptidase (beta-lactamase class C family)
MAQGFVRLLSTLTMVSSLLTLSATSLASDIRITKAKKVGMSSSQLVKLDEMGQRYIDNKQYSGLVSMVARKGKVVHFSAHGNMSVDNNTPMKTDSLFRIYSMTKPITAVAAMILYEEGKFQLNDPVSKYLPEFADVKVLQDGELVAPTAPMTIRQLFTHSTGLSYGFATDNSVDEEYRKIQPLESKSLAEFVTKVTKIPLRFEPGTRYQYSVSYDVLGAIIEKLSGMPLDEFFQQRIFKPLGMQDTFFQVPANKLKRLAGDQYWDANNKKVAAVPADRQRDYTNVSLFSGGGGLVSSASDYMRFAQMVLNGGSYNGVRILGPKTVQYMGLNHLTPEARAEGVGEFQNSDLYAGQSMALGFGVVTNPALMPATSSLGEISWAGVAGTKFWIDPKEEIIGIAMVQQYSAPWPLRFDMKVAAYSAITELNE